MALPPYLGYLGLQCYALRREAGTGAQATHGASRGALSREVGGRGTGTRDTPKAALSREAGTTPPPLFRALLWAVRAW
jgi:hypothetical protein